MRCPFVLAPMPCALALALVSCGGGGGGGSSAASAAPTGIRMPSELSPVPPVARPAGTSGILPADLLADLAPTDPGTDYSTAVTSRFVVTPALAPAELINQILKAMAQTHYADAANINAGPYQAIVGLVDDTGDGPGTFSDSWIVDSRLVQGVNVVDAWIDDAGQLAAAQFRITAPPTQAADGSYTDYGQWSLNVKFDDTGANYLLARAVPSPDGSVLSLNIHILVQGEPAVIQAQMVRSPDAGYGKVASPDSSHAGQTVQQTYTYNAGQLLLQQNGGTTYQDRTASVDLVQSYGVFDGATGANVINAPGHHFAFPLLAQPGGTSQAAILGEYLLLNGMTELVDPAAQGPAGIPDGTAFTRLDPGASGTTYLTASFPGALVKTTQVKTDPSLIQGIPVALPVSYRLELIYDGSQWRNYDSTAAPFYGTPFTNFAAVITQPDLPVTIGNGQGPSFVYNPTATPPGFYDASSGTLYAATNDTLQVIASGVGTFEYTASGWSQLVETGIDATTGQPIFAAGSYPALLPPGTYFFNVLGNSYGLTATTVGTTTTFDLEAQLATVANPLNLAALVGNGVLLVPPGYDPVNPNQTSTYTFDPDPDSATFMSLVYASVGPQEPATARKGAVVAQPVPGLADVSPSGAFLGNRFEWAYSTAPGGRGYQTFLYSQVSGGQKSWLIPDPPIAFRPVTLATAAGSSVTLSLQFDGWMEGLPDFLGVVAGSGGSLPDAVAAAVVNLPAGQQLTGADGHPYLVKPLEVGVFLKPAAKPDPSLDLTLANGINLADPAVLPQYSDNGMGAPPSPATVKYIYGVLQSQ